MDHTVLRPQFTIADIVPARTGLVTEARIRTEDVNRVHNGQAADIRLAFFKRRTTPLVESEVDCVAAGGFDFRCALY